MATVNVPAGMKAVFVPDLEPKDAKLRALYHFALEALDRLAEAATVVACADSALEAGEPSAGLAGAARDAARREGAPGDELRLALHDVEVVTAALAHLQSYEDVVDVLIADTVLQVARPDPELAAARLSADDALRRVEHWYGVALNRTALDDAVNAARDEFRETAFEKIEHLLHASGRGRGGEDPAQALWKSYQRWRRRPHLIATDSRNP